MASLASASWAARLSLLGLGLAVLAVGLVSVTLTSAHGGSTALIHSCVRTIAGPGGNPPKGQIRIVGANDACNAGHEQPLDWSGQAATSPPVTFITAAVTGSTGGFAPCPVGMRATAGGVTLLNGSGSVLLNSPAVAIIVQDEPTQSGDGWAGSAVAISPGNITPFALRITAFCS